MPQPAQGTTSLGFDRRTFLRGGLVAAGAGLAAPSLAGCGSSTTKTASGKDVVSVRFNWTLKGEFTPFFVAREKGYYDKENLKVKLEEGKSGTQAVQVVGTGKDDFGYIPSIQVCQGVNKGVPLKSVATMGRYTGMCWASWPGIPLDGPRSLLGQRVSISTSSTFFQVWPAFHKHFHLDTSKIKVVHPDPSARDGLFLRHDLDVMADIFYANDYVILQDKVDKKLNLLRMSDLHFDPLGYLLVVNKSLLEDKPHLVRRMVRATLKGFKYTLANPDEAISIMTKAHAKKLDPKVIKGQVHNMLDLILQKPALGKATDKMWTDSLDLLSTSGVIKQKKKLSDYYTNEFLS